MMFFKNDAKLCSKKSLKQANCALIYQPDLQVQKEEGEEEEEMKVEKEA